MNPKYASWLRDGLILIGVLALLSLLALGQIAGVVLIAMPLVFLFFGRRPASREASEEARSDFRE